MNLLINESFNKLFEYVKNNNYEGYDIYDGLNSELFRNTFLYKSRFFRLCLIQFCKLSCINFRKLLKIKKGFNPKAGALFLEGLINKYIKTKNEIYKIEAYKIFEKLKENKIDTTKGIGFGYNFDWQARAFFVERNTPNAVVSVFVGNAFLKFYDVFKEESALSFAKLIANFLINDMIIFENEKMLCFRYIPNENAQVHNVNLLVAAFLAKISKYTKTDNIKEKIIKAVNFSISDINKDGSWAYGTLKHHRWCDNFHSAFNIISLIKINEIFDDINLDSIIENNISYYLENFYTKECLIKYYNNSIYPTDIHSISVALILFDRIVKTNYKYDNKKLEKIKSKLLETLFKFQDKNGWFYCSKTKYILNKIPYIRWSQGWVFKTLSLF